MPAPPLGTSLYERLREEILTGAVRPGQLISERALVEQYGASRTPIRYAVARLQEMGFLTSQGRRGYVVSVVGIQEIAEILFLRTLLEGAAAEQAARFITEEELENLTRLAGASYVPGDATSYGKFVRANREFHLAIAGASRNARLRRLIGALLDDMDRVIAATVALSYRVGDMQQDHRTIVESLARRDPEEARRVVQAAMEASRRRIAEALRLADS
jgi:DNA-binding GntR family transcriptional regulator